MIDNKSEALIRRECKSIKYIRTCDVFICVNDRFNQSNYVDKYFSNDSG